MTTLTHFPSLPRSLALSVPRSKMWSYRSMWFQSGHVAKSVHSGHVAQSVIVVM